VADVFDEVDEELRREKLESTWKKYGVWFVSAALLIVAATAGLQWWRAYQLSSQRDAGAAYEAALEVAAERESADAARTLAGFAESAPDGFAAVAWLQSAGYHVDAGDTEAALGIYNTLADAGETPEDLRNIARILAAGILVDTGDSVAVEERLGPTLDATNPWRFSAREMMALAALKAGDTEKARSTYQQLAGDAQTPPDLRERASEMVRALAPAAS